jgi:putative ABC transport system permease protein
LNKVLNKRIIRNIRINIKSYISIIIISLIAALFYTGFEANYHYLYNRVNKEITKSNLADNYVTVNSFDSGDGIRLKNNYIYDVNSLDYVLSNIDYEVEDIEYRFYCDAYYEERELFIVASPKNNKMNVYAEITECMEGYSNGEGVYVTEAFAKRREIEIGDTIEVSVKASLKDIYYDATLEEDFKNNVKPGMTDIYNADEFKISFKVNGFIKHAEAVGKNASSPGIIYMETNLLKKYINKTIEDNFNFDDETLLKYETMVLNLNLYNQYLIRGGNLSKIREYFLSKPSNNMNLANPMDMLPTLSILLADVLNTKTFSYIFPLVFYICAILIVIATILKEIDNEEPNIGLMNALGINKRTIAMHYSMSTISSILIGGVIGLILGPIVIPLGMNLKYNELYDLVSTKSILYYPSYIIIFIILISIALLTSLIKVYAYLRISPSDAMKRNRVARGHKLSFNFLPFKFIHLKMALRNIFWAPLKSLMVIIGVIGCTALLIVSLGVEDTVQYGIDLELNKRVTYDVEISYEHGFDTNLIASLEGVDRIETFGYSVVMAYNEDSLVDTTITVIDNNSKSVNVELKAGGCTISKKLAETLNLSLGDSISIYQKNKVYSIPITNIMDVFWLQTIYISKDDYKNFDTIHDNRMYIDLKDGYNKDYIVNQINEMDNIIFTRTIEARRDIAYQYFDMLMIVTNFIKIFAIILAIAVIYDLVSLNYKERIRDIAQIKVLGYGYGSNIKTLLYEIGILSTIGFIFGSILGKPLMIKMLKLNENLSVSFIPYINWRTYLITFVLIILVGFILNLLLSIRINKLDMVKSLEGAE